MSFKDKINSGFERFKTEKKIKIYVGAVLVAVIVFVAGAIIINNIRNEVKNEQKIATYTIPENEKIFINGLIVPKESKAIMPPMNGSTPDIRVSNGQRINAGDVLYIAKNEAAIEEISSIKTQIRNLISEKSRLKSDDPALVTINGQIANLNASLSAANAKAYTRVKAPFSGRVFLNNNQTHDSQANGALMTVQSTDYVMNGQISEQDLSKLKNDMTVTITILSTGDALKGRVSYISDRPIISSNANTNDISFYNIVFTLDSQEGVVDGYHAQASIEVNTDKHRIPTSAIINDGSEVYVLAEADGFYKKVNIEVISDSNNYSIVSGDLSENEVIVKNPTKNIKEGDPIPQDQKTKSDSSKDKSDN